MDKESPDLEKIPATQVEKENSIPEEVEKIIESGSPKYRKGYNPIQPSWKSWSKRWGSKD